MKRTIQCKHSMDINKCYECYPIFLEETAMTPTNPDFFKNRTNERLVIESARLKQLLVATSHDRDEAIATLEKAVDLYCDS